MRDQDASETHIFHGAGALLVVGIVVFGLLAWRPAIPEADASTKPSFDNALVAKGAALVLIGNCNVCHTKNGG